MHLAGRMMAAALLLGAAPMALAVAPWARSAGEADQTTWRLANFTWVKRVPAEAGAAPSAHPAALSPEALQALLAPVQVTVEERPEPLFARDELKGLARALSEALALARPGEDLLLLSTAKRHGGFMETALGLTARLFVADGALHLLVHDARLDFMGRYAAEHRLPDFVYGSRAQASTTPLQAPGARALRADWLALPLAAMSAPAPAAMSAPAPAGMPAPAPAATSAPAPAVAASPLPPPAPAADPAPAPVARRDEAFYEAQALRLKALKKLRDEGLLSEAEYQQKREAILKTL